MENLHWSLSQQNFPPSQHLVDAGYIDTELLITACAINLVRVWEWWTEAYTFGTSPSRFAALST